MAKLSRTSFTLPPEILQDLDYISGFLGVSRSAFLASIAGPALSDVRHLLEDLPPLPESQDSLRFRGDSIALIRMRLQSLEQMVQGDLVSPGASHHA